MKKWIVVGGLLALGGIVFSTRFCVPALFRYGLWLHHCPDGQLRQTVNVSSGTLERGKKGTVYVGAQAHFTHGSADQQEIASLDEFSPEVMLVGPGVQEKIQATGWEKSGSQRHAQLAVPKVNDGDYVLKVTVHSTLGQSTLELPVPFYAPARVHVITDRPLYEPGNVVRFRAVALRASDLAPLDGRPGVFRITAPNGDVLLEERAPAREWGIAEGSFPLDQQAESGDWRVSWSSGSATESRTFAVRPFTLPRFRVEANSLKPFYGKRERPQLKGEVRYSSGAPVARAKVELQWSVSGDWPPPLSWVSGDALPKLATTDPSGVFRVELPPVPEDLRGRATVAARLAVVDDSGDRVEGAAWVLLAEDAIKVDAVAELQGGLVEGFNNRVYLRVTTADGRVLDRASVHVRRLWEPTDKGVTQQTDEDGVAALQLDPGPPVNVVIPPQPFRPPPPARPVTRGQLTDLLTGEVSLPDRLAFDRIEAKLQVCARFVTQPQLDVAVRISAGGKVVDFAGPQTRAGECVVGVLRGLTLSPGAERILSASYAFDDSDLPRLHAEVVGAPAVPAEVPEAIEEALVAARDCIPTQTPSGNLPRQIAWSYRPTGKPAPISFVAATDAMYGFPEAAMRCIEQRLSTLKLGGTPAANRLVEPDAEESESAETGSIGYARLAVEAPEKYDAVRPQATTLVGYEFQVTAKLGNDLMGSTRMVMTPGEIPPLRLRAAPQIVAPGQKVRVELLRGPQYTQPLPPKVWLSRPGGAGAGFDLDAATRATEVVVPVDAEGWLQLTADSAQTFLFVTSNRQLQVKLTADQERYAPGQTATLELSTTVAGKGTPAAVGLFGVDNSLSQLAPLPTAAELNGLRPTVGSTPAFEGIDAQALALGRVRGANAAAATVLRVSHLPSPSELETPVTVSGQTHFDAWEGLTDHFYVVLEQLHTKARAWEAAAPETEKMTPRKMAEMWNAAVAQVAAGPDPKLAQDGWGRPLRLHRLPPALLALTEPRQVIAVGTRLPEDTENWTAFVRKEKP